MSGNFKAEDPDEIKFTVTFTLTLSEWKQIKDQFEKSWLWPSSYIVDSIRDMTTQAEKIFYHMPKE